MKHARQMVGNITLNDDRLIIVCLAKVFNQMEVMLTDPDIKNVYDMNQEMAQLVKRTTVHEMSHLSCVWDLARLAVERIHDRATIEDYQKVSSRCSSSAGDSTTTCRCRRASGGPSWRSPRRGPLSGSSSRSTT